MRTTQRTSPAEEHNFTEISTGDAPCSIELSMNAKGLVQPTIKLYYPDADTLERSGPDQARRIMDALTARFQTPASEERPA